MSSSSKKTKEAHCVVCRCKARKCYLGNYIDAYGQPQSGVEVLPSTRDAHTRADMRKQALDASSELASSPNTHIPTPGDLVTSLEELHLPSVNIPSQSRKSAEEQPLPTSTTKLRTSIRGTPQRSTHFAFSSSERHAPPRIDSTECSDKNKTLPRQESDNNTTDFLIPSYDCGM